jgi:hypothetical protein
MANSYADLMVLKSGGVLNISGATFDARLLAILEDVSRWIDNYCNRHFYVLEATRRFDGSGSRALAVPDLISVTTLKTDEDQDRIFEVTWGSGDYLLYPLNAEPQQPWGRPYTRVLVDTEAGTRAVFPSGKSAVEITGMWGFRQVVEDSGADINEGGALGSADTMLTVTDGSKFAVGQTLLIESEQVYLTGIATNDLTVERGINGTAAASHSDGSDIFIYRYPGSVMEACLFQASRLWRQRGGDSTSAVGGRAVDGELDPEVRRLLSPYRRLPVGLGV